MKKISRRDFVRLTGKTVAAVFIANLLKIIPEAKTVFAAGQNDEKWSFAASNDPSFGKSLAAIKSTPEYIKYKDTLANQNPVYYWHDTESKTNFMNFIVQEPALSDPEAFRKSPVYLLQTLIFATDNEYNLVDAFLITPDAQSLSETSNLKSTMKSLREGTQQEIEHHERISDEIQKLYKTSQKSKEVAKKAVEGTSDKKVDQSCTNCDCGLHLMYSCAHQTCGGGYVDSGCYRWCVIPCTLIPSGPGRIACMVACNGVCWVPPYCYCDTYRCGSCRC
jgi:ubiquitin